MRLLRKKKWCNNCVTPECGSCHKGPFCNGCLEYTNHKCDAWVRLLESTSGHQHKEIQELREALTDTNRSANELQSETQMEQINLRANYEEQVRLQPST